METIQQNSINDPENSEVIFKRKPEIVAREIAGEHILVPVAGKIAELQQIYALNQVAEFIWNRIDGLSTLREIYHDVLNSFEVEPQVLKQDILEFLDELVKLQLVEFTEVS